MNQSRGRCLEEDGPLGEEPPGPMLLLLLLEVPELLLLLLLPVEEEELEARYRGKGTQLRVKSRPCTRPGTRCSTMHGKCLSYRLPCQRNGRKEQPETDEEKQEERREREEREQGQQRLLPFSSCAAASRRARPLLKSKGESRATLQGCPWSSNIIE